MDYAKEAERELALAESDKRNSDLHLQKAQIYATLVGGVHVTASGGGGHHQYDKIVRVTHDGETFTIDELVRAYSDMHGGTELLKIIEQIRKNRLYDTRKGL